MLPIPKRRRKKFLLTLPSRRRNKPQLPLRIPAIVSS